MSDSVDTDGATAFYAAYDAVLAKWPADTSTREVQGDFGSTRVNSCGSEGSPPMVLLPGGGATSTVWFANVAALSEHHRVHAIDLMGDVGRSVNDGRPMNTVDDLLDWLCGVLEELHLMAPRIVGHSYGAMIALAHALRSPERVGSLVLVDPNSCFAGMRPAYLAHAVPMLVRPTEKRVRAFIAWETGGASIDDTWLTTMVLGAVHLPRSKTIVPKRPSSKALSALHVPTTVAVAGRSKVHDASTVAGAVRESMPDARIVVIDDATHHTLPMVPAGALDAVLLRNQDGV